jgi:nicotinamidase-related amidase
MSLPSMLRLDPGRTAVVAIDMHRGHLDPAVATLPLPAERCGPVVKRAAALFADLRARGVPVVHVVTEYRDAAEIAANPFWKAAHDDPTKARRGILKHNLVGSPGTEIIPELHASRDLVVRSKKRYSVFHPTDLEFVLRRRLGVDTVILGGHRLAADQRRDSPRAPTSRRLTCDPGCRHSPCSSPSSPRWRRDRPWPRRGPSRSACWCRRAGRSPPTART